MSIYQLHHIETPRLMIRPVQLGDEYGLHKSIERSAFALQKWMPWAKDTSFNASKHFIHRNYECWKKQTSKDFPLIVLHKGSGEIISVSGFNEHTDLIKPLFEIGYWIDTSFEGQGLATELVNALTRYALDGLQAIRTQICTQVGNDKSTAIPKRCGYVYEAMLRNICLDCTSKLPADGLLFSCCDTALLPPLDVTWQQNTRIILKPETTIKSEELFTLDTTEIGLIDVDHVVPHLKIQDNFYEKTSEKEARNAVVALIHHAFTKRNAKCIQWPISEKNTRSLDLAKSLGWQHEGSLKNYFKDSDTNELSAAELFSMCHFSQMKKELF